SSFTPHGGPLVFSNVPSTTEISTLSLHDALPISGEVNLRMADVVIVNKVDSAPRDKVETVLRNVAAVNPAARVIEARSRVTADEDRKSTRLNSSHVKISYAVFCLKKKKRTKTKE